MFGRYCLFGPIHNSWTKLSQSLVVDIFLVIILNYLNMVYTCLLCYTPHPTPACFPARGQSARTEGRGRPGRYSAPQPWRRSPHQHKLGRPVRGTDSQRPGRNYQPHAECP